MRIKKTSETTPRSSETVNTFSNSTKDSYACSYANNTFQTKGTVLWTNSNPSSAFEGGTITLSSNDYDYIDIIFNNYITRNTYDTARIYNISGYFELDALFNYMGAVYAGSRYAQFTDNGNKIAFETAFGKEVGASGAVSAQSSWAVPYKIIGYKE